MEVHLPHDQEAQPIDLAVKTGRGTDELVQEANRGRIGLLVDTRELVMSPPPNIIV
jgi:hypothetical protein